MYALPRCHPLNFSHEECCRLNSSSAVTSKFLVMKRAPTNKFMLLLQATKTLKVATLRMVRPSPLTWDDSMGPLELECPSVGFPWSCEVTTWWLHFILHKISSSFHRHQSRECFLIDFIYPNFMRSASWESNLQRWLLCWNQNKKEWLIVEKLRT